MYILCEKAKKEDKTISVDVTLNMPSESFYNLVAENFGSEDDVIEYIMANLDFQLIKDRIRYSLKKIYKTYGEY